MGQDVQLWDGYRLVSDTQTEKHSEGENTGELMRALMHARYGID